jgi:hypothetical protein
LPRIFAFTPTFFDMDDQTELIGGEGEGEIERK